MLVIQLRFSCFCAKDFTDWGVSQPFINYLCLVLPNTWHKKLKGENALDFWDTVAQNGRKVRQHTQYMSALPKVEVPSFQEAGIKDWIFHRIHRVDSPSISRQFRKDPQPQNCATSWDQSLELRARGTRSDSNCDTDIAIKFYGCILWESKSLLQDYSTDDEMLIFFLTVGMTSQSLLEKEIWRSHGCSLLKRFSQTIGN